jgi:hypothetical protein
MPMLARLLAARPRKNQQAIAGRAADVIGHVLFDIGVDRFVNGTIVLDKRFRLRFFGGTPMRGPDIIATVALRELAEAREFHSQGLDGSPAGAPLDVHIGCVVRGLMRELNAQSAQLRALS